MELARVWTVPNWERLLVGDLFNTGAIGGLLVTLLLGLGTIVLSTLLGTLIGLVRAGASRALRLAAGVYVQSFRNVPALILIFWVFFFPPLLGIELSRFASVLVALTLFTAAYIAEIVDGGIRSVAPGHVEAARALGMSALEIRLWIVLPQAFFNMLPALAGRYVVAIKNTSLAFLIGLADLTEIGKEIGARLMTAPIEVYITLMLLYFVVNRGLSALMRRLEDRTRFNRIFLHI
ncbi:MAG TPA: amino acid ABC transporter permease [Candidatus Sulfotelmatobacter sp.]|nr:amino acid ABC transporter permease [Candidatus Sulfotelmatobacter sp.]